MSTSTETMSTSTETILAERSTTHGDFTSNSTTAQDLKRIMRRSKNWATLSCPQQEALEMIAHKIGRILAGDPNHKDHWDDISGYAVLVSKRL